MLGALMVNSNPARISFGLMLHNRSASASCDLGPIVCYTFENAKCCIRRRNHNIGHHAVSCALGLTRRPVAHDNTKPTIHQAKEALRDSRLRCRPSLVTCHLSPQDRSCQAEPSVAGVLYFTLVWRLPRWSYSVVRLRCSSGSRGYWSCQECPLSLWQTGPGLLFL